MHLRISDFVTLSFFIGNVKSGIIKKWWSKISRFIFQLRISDLMSRSRLLGLSHAEGGGQVRNLFYGFFHLRILGHDMHSQVVNQNMRKSTTENMFKKHYVQNVNLT